MQDRSMTTQQEEYLKIPDAASYLGVSVSTIRNLIRTPGFPAFRVGRQIRIPRSRLDLWLLTNTVA